MCVLYLSICQLASLVFSYVRIISFILNFSFLYYICMWFFLCLYCLYYVYIPIIPLCLYACIPKGATKLTLIPKYCILGSKKCYMCVKGGSLKGKKKIVFFVIFGIDSIECYKYNAETFCQNFLLEEQLLLKKCDNTRKIL